jgi:hypothetical protein
LLIFLKNPAQRLMNEHGVVLLFENNVGLYSLPLKQFFGSNRADTLSLRPVLVSHKRFDEIGAFCSRLKSGHSAALELLCTPLDESCSDEQRRLFEPLAHVADRFVVSMRAAERYLGSLRSHFVAVNVNLGNREFVAATASLRKSMSRKRGSSGDRERATLSHDKLIATIRKLGAAHDRHTLYLGDGDDDVAGIDLEDSDAVLAWAVAEFDRVSADVVAAKRDRSAMAALNRERQELAELAEIWLVNCRLTLPIE